MLTQHLTLAISWMLYCALHSLFASIGWKRRAQSVLGKNFRYYRLGYTVFAFVSLAAVIAFQAAIRSPFVFQANVLSKIAGSVLMVFGVVVMGVCIRKYFMHLSGLKSLYLNDEQAKNRLQVSGIHRFVRHPLYSGTFMAIWGLWLLLPHWSLLIANLVITGYTVMAIFWEEQKLLQEFGEDYRRYQRQVPRLVPLPWRKAGTGF